MRLCKVKLASGVVRIGVQFQDEMIQLMPDTVGPLSAILHADNPVHALRTAATAVTVKTSEVTFLSPLDQQEVWAAGVTYKRSQEARERESEGAAAFYDKVYTAPRPEIFFKAPAWRVSPPEGPVHIRRDSQWNVPEPELALVISPKLELVGFSIGNDMSSRDIEGENPLYLPQAKMYDNACAIGPSITLAAAMPEPDQTAIRLTIVRAGKTVFEGATKVSAMKRSFAELIDWLGKEMAFPDGVVLLTGTGVIPPDDFSLAVGDVVHIDITGIGRLTNVVQQRSPAVR
ncbi:MAG: fumarylacetoacetate hydrolase family protein [Planctomycetota bacterium]|jgi:2-dehydro-3-deoxy-D-arabinonate dehydratase